MTNKSTESVGAAAATGDYYVAHWSRECRGKIIITDRAGNEVDSFTVSPDGARPGHGLLCGVAWAPYPGSEWDEEPPGHWSVSVFSEGGVG